MARIGHIYVRETVMSQDIRIALPLPLGLVGEVMDAIGHKYPNAVIVPSPNGELERHLVMRIPDEDMYDDDVPEYDDDEFDDCTDEPARPVVDPIRPAVKRNPVDKELEATLTEWSEDVVGMGLPDVLSANMVALAREIVEAYPTAANYVEMNAYDKETGKHWVVTVLNPDGKTPHELRREAEETLAVRDERIKTLEAALRLAIDEIEHIPDQQAMTDDSFVDRTLNPIKAALNETTGDEK